jgi:hypothetical protein
VTFKTQRLVLLALSVNTNRHSCKKIRMAAQHARTSVMKATLITLSQRARSAYHVIKHVKRAEWAVDQLILRFVSLVQMNSRSIGHKVASALLK